MKNENVTLEKILMLLVGINDKVDNLEKDMVYVKSVLKRKGLK